MADSRAPSMVFGCLRPMLVCRRSSYECWELCPWSRKGSHSSKWRCSGKDHVIPCHTRLRFDGIMATVCSCTKIRQVWLSSLARKPWHCLTWFFWSNKIEKCWEWHVQSTIVSVNNCGNGMRLKWWHFFWSPYSVTLILWHAVRTAHGSVALFQALTVSFVRYLKKTKNTKTYHVFSLCTNSIDNLQYITKIMQLVHVYCMI